MYSNMLMMSSNPIRVPHNQNYSPSPINGQSYIFQDHYVETYKSLVLDEAEKLYGRMVKDLVIEIMGDITSAN
jgi:hypothetical protein